MAKSKIANRKAKSKRLATATAQQGDGIAMPQDRFADGAGAGPEAAAGGAFQEGQSDFGALNLAERQARGDVVVLEETVHAGVRRARVRTQSMMDRYLHRDQITQRQYDAGMRLYAAWRASGSAQTVVAHYGLRIQGGGEMSQRQAAIRADVTAALVAMGTRLASALVHVCLCDEAAGDWGERQRGKAADGIPVLRLALDSLADYWGLQL